MKTPITLALALFSVIATAQPFNNTYDINANYDKLNPSFVIVNNNNESISVSNGTTGSSNYFVLTKLNSGGGVVYNNIVRTSNDPVDGFLHVEALHETMNGDLLVSGFYYKDHNFIVEQPFLARFDNNGKFMWSKIYFVNNNPIVHSDKNKISLCRIKNSPCPGEEYFLVASSDSDREPGKGVATNVIKVDVSAAGAMIFSHKYYETSPNIFEDIREYPGDIEYSQSKDLYMITGHREHMNKDAAHTEYMMYYFVIDHNGAVHNNLYTTLMSKSIPIDQDMIYDKDKDLFPTVFTHEKNGYISGVQSLIGFIKMDINLGFSDPGMLWHHDGLTHNGRSISHSNNNGEYFLGAGTFDQVNTQVYNPALQRVKNNGHPAMPFLRYNVKDDVYFGHHTMNPNTHELVLVNDHKTDLREIWTDPNGKACGMREFEPIYKDYDPKQFFYKYDYKKQGKCIKYEVKEKLFTPDYRKCDGEGDHYRMTGISAENMGNNNALLYPSVLNTQQALVTVENNTGTKLRVEVRNITGQLVFSAEQIGSGKQELNLSGKGGLAAGVYLVNLFDTKGQLSNSTRIVVSQ
jgi:hypothetical protein